MNRKYLISIFFISICFFLYSQSVDNDNLKKISDKFAIENTINLEVLSPAFAGASTQLNDFYNQIDVVFNSDNISFDSRFRLQFDTDFNKIAKLYFPEDQLRFNAKIHPLIIKGLEIAAGTNIGYKSGPSSNWYKEYDYNSYNYWLYPVLGYESISTYGIIANEWASKGIAIKYSLFGVEIGVAIPVQEFTQESKTKLNANIKYTLDDIFSLGISTRAQFQPQAMQTVYVGATANILSKNRTPNLPALSAEVFFTYISAWIDSFGYEESYILYNANYTFGMRFPVSFSIFTIKPEFAINFSDIKRYNDYPPFFTGIDFGADINDRLQVALWTSFATGYYQEDFDNNFYIIPNVKIITKIGEFSAGLGFRVLTTSNIHIFGTNFPISWKVKL